MSDLRFSKHYTLDEARALLPSVRKWLARLQELSRKLKTLEDRIEQLMKTGDAIGGSSVNDSVRVIDELNTVVSEFRERQIQIKDLERGLLDFPSILNGREVFLCWEQDEADIEFWHELDSGYAGRERL